MANLISLNSVNWEEIELAERYFVSSKFEKASSITASVLDRILKTDSCTSIAEENDDDDDIQLSDMIESAGMVFVQSLKELGRTSEIRKELKRLFGSVTNIPIQVLLTGAGCYKSDGLHSDLCDFLDEFLGKWRCGGGEFCILVNEDQNGGLWKGHNTHSVLKTDTYLAVVDFYAIKLLGGQLNNIDLAIAWVEKAQLPDEKQQDLLRRLRSLFAPKGTCSSQSEEKPSQKNGAEYSGTESTVSGSGKMSRAPKGRYPLNGGDGRKQAILNFTEKVEPCFWWFRSINLKFGSARLVISHGKIALWGSFIVFICYVLQKKRATMRRIARRQASSVKKALVDMWQLAFSVQVNPLAAIQPLPAATQGSRG
ncbi:Apem9 [Thalictrum thalictroides]|uniref:Apem9 n=1 Tax=Thalictrum thalictroides TaxID=46969 RepID=A0A7J6X4D6_THATH|nr:Apem9 [Thalictrum thalictroides]